MYRAISTVALLVATVLMPLSASAQAVATPIEAVDFEHTTRSIVLTKLQRFFTLSPQKDVELTDAIANTLLLKAAEQDAAGQSNQADATLAKYQRESELLDTLVTTIGANTDNQQVQDFLDGLATDRVVQLALIEQTTKQEGTDLAAKLASEQAKVLRSIVALLERQNDIENQQERLATVFAHYSKKEAELEQRLAKRLALAAKLDDETDSTELEDQLEQAEDAVLADAAELDDSAVALLTSTLEDKLKSVRRATILTKLLAVVPTASKATITAAIDQLIQKELSEAGDDEAALKKLVDSHSDSAVIQEKIIEKLKEHADEPTKQKLEVAKKQVEAQREAAKKAAESKQELARQTEEKSDDDATDEAETSDTGTSAGATPSSPNSSTPTTSTPTTTTPSTSSGSGSSTPVAEKETIEIKVDDDSKFDKSSYTVAKGTELTVKFKNESETSRTLTLSNGKSATVGKGETTVAAFTFDTALTFTATDVTGSGTIRFK